MADRKTDILPDRVRELVARRQKARKSGDFAKSDIIRKQLVDMNYSISDTPDSSVIAPIASQSKPPKLSTGRIAVFGSGELSATGRRIHEYLIKMIDPPVKIALLETPAGFEDNPHHWYKKLETMLYTGLKNYKPDIIRIEAIQSDGIESTNNPAFVEPLMHADYIHTGAGSPTYAANHLRDSLALSYIKKRLLEGCPVSIASAATFAFSRYLLPVYELYFAGAEPHWETGLDFFWDWRLNLTFIPHWDNTEGGKDIDTRFGYMGEKRFSKLRMLLPGPTTIIGIDEHTACLFDVTHESMIIMGKGTVSVINSDSRRVYTAGEELTFEALRIPSYNI